MKSKVLLIAFCLLATSFTVAQTESLKKYQIKSFIVEYKITASGSFNGMGSVNSEGTKTLYVDNYGALEASEKIEKSTTIMMGTTQVENRHELDLTDAKYIYHIDLIKKSGTKIEVASAQQMANAMYEGMKNKYSTTDPKVIGRKIIEENGGKWLGNESFLGNNCEVFEMMGVKIWSYQNITLKSEGTMAGITSTEVATSIKENVAIPSSRFNFPDGITFEELLDPTKYSYDMPTDGYVNEEGSSDVSNITLTLDQFKAGVSKISQPGFQSMGTMADGGTFGATYVNFNGTAFMVQAVDMISSSEMASAEGVEVVKSLTINGHSAKVIKTDESEEEDTEAATSVMVSYPEFNMHLVIVGSGNISSELLESVAGQVKF